MLSLIKKIKKYLFVRTKSFDWDNVDRAEKTKILNQAYKYYVSYEGYKRGRDRFQQKVWKASKKNRLGIVKLSLVVL